MFQPKSLAGIAGAHVCNQDDEFKLCVKIIATEKAITKRRRHRQAMSFTRAVVSPSGRDYAVMKRWAVDFKRVHMQHRQPIDHYRWDFAQACVDGHPDPSVLLPRDYLARRGGADDEVDRVVKAVTKSWALLDRDGIPRREARIPERRQVHDLCFDAIRECLAHRRLYSLDRKAEMRCRHNAGTNMICWRPPCGPPEVRSDGDRHVPPGLADTLFWDSD